jgi:hypothetical protein
MPNFFSAFTNDVFRPLATLLIPGAIGVSTWFVALMWRFPALNDLAGRNHADAGFVLLLATIFAGMVFEDFGARWEVRLDRWADRRTDNEHTKNWWIYLRTAFKSDPIGRRYARTLVLRLKFELGIAFAMISAALGLIWLTVLGLSFSATAWLGLFCLLFTTWGLLEAKETHKVLSKTRAALLEGIHVIE